MDKDIRDSILELLIKSKGGTFTSKALSSSYNKSEDDINIIIDLILEQSISGYQIIDSETLNDDSYIIWSNKYTQYFIDAGGFTAIQEQERDCEEEAKEIKEQEKIDNDLDRELKRLQIDNTKRSIKFYSRRYYWMFAFAVLGFVFSWFSKQPLLEILTTQNQKVEELQQLPSLETRESDISIQDTIISADSL